jgi:hypothetical protein
MFRGPFSRNLAPGYRKVMFEGYTEMPIEGTSVVHMNTATRAYIDDMNLIGFGTLVEKVEGGPITLQDPIPGGVKRYTFTTFGLGFRVTQEMYEDDLYGIAGNKLSRALGASVRNNFELVAFSPYNNAFNTAYNGFVSGEPLVSATHTSFSGGAAQSNLIAGDFGILTLQAALENFHSMRNDRGMPIVYTPKLLIHSVGDMWAVNSVLKSEGYPGGSLNDPNPIKPLGLTSKMVHYLDDPDAWFLIANNHDVNYFDRRKPTFRSGDDLITGDAIYLVTRRNGAGFGDWRGVVGSPGA